MKDGLVVEPLDNYDEINVKLYSSVSAVLLWSQYVEEMLTMHVLLSDVSHGKVPRTGLKIHFDRLNKSTLGRLHEVWKKSVQMPDELESLILKALDGRNFVCHKLFVEDKEKMLHQTGKLELVRKCIEIAEDLKKLYYVLDWMFRFLAKHLQIDISRAIVTQDDLRSRAIKRFEINQTSIS